MNKNEFLRALEQELSVLDKTERDELLDFYKERFYNGVYYENKSEQQVVSELEPPRVIARNILEQYGVSPKRIKTPEERFKGVSGGSIAWLVMVDLFVLSWLIPTLFAMTVGMFGSLLGFIPAITLIIGEKSIYDVMLFGFLSGLFIVLFHFALLILDLLIWTIKKSVTFHLNTFKVRNRATINKKLNNVSVDGFFKKRKVLNSVKRLTFIGGLVLLGVFGFRLATSFEDIMALYNNQIDYVATETLDVTDEINDNEVWTIETNVDNMQVVLIPTDSNEIILTKTYQEENFTFEWAINPETNTIYINQDIDDDHWNFNIDINLEEIMKMIKPDIITIEVPSNLLLDEATLNTLNGTVTVENVSLNDLDIETANGRVTLENVSINNDINVKTANGNILINNISVDDLYADTSNGRIKVEDSVLNNITLDTSNGRIILENINVDERVGVSAELDTSNGDIRLTNVYISSVDAKTSNGDIVYNNEDTTFDVDFDKSTTNGSITGNVN